MDYYQFILQSTYIYKISLSTLYFLHSTNKNYFFFFLLFISSLILIALP